MTFMPMDGEPHSASHSAMSEEVQLLRAELRHVKDELERVGDQLQSKIRQLESMTNDFANLLGSIQVAALFLDVVLRVRRFTPAIMDLVELHEVDIGRPLTILTRSFADETLLEDARYALQRLAPIEREIQSDSGRWYLRRSLPYRTHESQIEGVVIIFIDIDARKRAEAETLANQQRLQAVLEQMPTAVVMVCAPDGRLLFANRQAEQLFPQTFQVSDAAERSSVFAPRLAGARVEAWPLFRALARNELIIDELITVVGEGGELKTLSANCAPVRGADGATIAAVGTFVDATSRVRGERQLSQVERRFQLLVDSAKDFAIFSTDPTGIIRSWNSGAERILGWDEKEAVGQPGAMLFTPEDRAVSVPERELSEAAQTGRATDERWHIRKDGSRFWASGVMARVDGPTGQIEGFVKVMRDQTDRKVFEEKLLVANKAAESARAELMEAIRAKDELIANVSHALRTPLNTIQIWTRIMSSDNLRDEDRQKGLRTIERAVGEQQQVIADLLDISRGG
jgi:two-component system CheB/CheR fusion protein